MRYVFDDWDVLREKFKGKRLLIFLDYDGTLTPIVRTPERAVISAATKNELALLSQDPCCKIAIISGRSLEDVRSKLVLKNVVYSGNHGLEIKGPGIRYAQALPSSHRASLLALKRDLGKKIAVFRGAFIEDKGLALTLHFRQVSPGEVAALKDVFYGIVKPYVTKHTVEIKAGKRVLEVRPFIAWDKGKVVVWLLARKKFTGPANGYVPIYIGDDRTDEDAFKAIGHSGITIRVGKLRSSCAQYYVNNSVEVRKILVKIAHILREVGRCSN